MNHFALCVAPSIGLQCMFISVALACAMHNKLNISQDMNRSAPAAGIGTPRHVHPPGDDVQGKHMKERCRMKSYKFLPNCEVTCLILALAGRGTGRWQYLNSERDSNTISRAYWRDTRFCREQRLSSSPTDCWAGFETS